MKAINEHFEVGQQYYALVSKEVLVVTEILQPGMYPLKTGGFYELWNSCWPTLLASGITPPLPDPRPWVHRAGLAAIGQQE